MGSSVPGSPQLTNCRLPTRRIIARVSGISNGSEHGDRTVIQAIYLDVLFPPYRECSASTPCVVVNRIPREEELNHLVALQCRPDAAFLRTYYDGQCALSLLAFGTDKPLTYGFQDGFLRLAPVEGADRH